MRSSLYVMERQDPPKTAFQERSHQATLGAMFGCYFAFMRLAFPPRSMSAHRRAISKEQSSQRHCELAVGWCQRQLAIILPSNYSCFFHSPLKKAPNQEGLTKMGAGITSRLPWACQVIMWHTLNTYRAACQLYPSETGRKPRQPWDAPYLLVCMQPFVMPLVQPLLTVLHLS